MAADYAQWERAFERREAARRIERHLQEQTWQLLGLIGAVLVILAMSTWTMHRDELAITMALLIATFGLMSLLVNHARAMMALRELLDYVRDSQ